MNHEDIDREIDRAVEAIERAEALVIGAGAGMGVDSGLPDFRGDKGFWKAYPPFRGRKFAEMSNPKWFRSDPEQAWGFFGHRLNLYRDSDPHAGFGILLRWARAMPHGYFVFTSNVDGHFQRTGFPDERIVECHGSINYLQCCAGCTNDIWPANDLSIVVDPETVRATAPLPTCQHCPCLARPNILMFGDMGWISNRTFQQEQRYAHWLETIAPRRLTIVEFGAGLAVPTVRWECERHNATLVRVNPRDYQLRFGGVALPIGALEAIRRIDERIHSPD